MSLRLVSRSVAAAAMLALGSGAVQADDVTLFGTHFDLTYDDTKLGLFGAPVLTGDVISFTFNNFKAESLNGQGQVNTNSTISGMVLTTKNGFNLTQLLLAEFGDYTLQGPNSTVNVAGQLRAFDINNSLFTQTTSNLAVSAATPLNLNDGGNHDWVASAGIDANTPTLAVPGGAPVSNWLGSASRIGVTIENRLSAYTGPANLGVPQEAFIEKKFAGVSFTVVSAVPEPAGIAGMLAGFAGLAIIARRRRLR